MAVAADDGLERYLADPEFRYCSYAIETERRLASRLLAYRCQATLKGHRLAQRRHREER